jgi:hypothetical protein
LCRGSGRVSVIGLSFVGRRNAWTNVERSVPVFDESEALTGMEGKYLKLGKRNAEAALLEGRSAEEGGKEEFVTITLLKGYMAGQK